MVVDPFQKALTAHFCDNKWPEDLKVGLRQTEWAKEIVRDNDYWDLPNPCEALGGGAGSNKGNGGDEDFVL